MLAELFMLRLEIMRRGSKPATSTRSGIRFVPIRLPAISVIDGPAISPKRGEPSQHVKAGPRPKPKHPHDIQGRRGRGVERPSMRRINNWIDEKPYRFQLILLGHTAVFLCALLIAMTHF
jgi:hypothetical protein